MAGGPSNPSQGSISDNDRGQTSQTNFMQAERPMTGNPNGTHSSSGAGKNFMVNMDQQRRTQTGMGGTGAFGSGGDSHDILD